MFAPWPTFVSDKITTKMYLQCDHNFWGHPNIQLIEYKNTNMVYLTKKAHILCQHHDFGPGIDCAITHHIETVYVQYIYLLVKCLGLVQFWYAFLINIQMDSMDFDLYSGTHGGFTFNSSLSFTSSDFSSRLFTYLPYFSFNVILYLTKPGCLQWNKKLSTICTSLQNVHLSLWTCLYWKLLFLQSHVKFMSSHSLVTVLLMLEDSIVDKYFFIECI